MKFVLGFFFALRILGCTLGAYLDDSCGDTVWVSSSSNNYYYIRSSGSFQSLCRVDFDTSSSKRIKLTITGTSLDSGQCQVNVYDNTDSYSKSGGNIDSSVSFTREVTSSSLGELYLHVQGSNCAQYGLSFTAQTTCQNYQFTCDSGQCVWSSDRCDGFSDCWDGSDEDGCFWSVGSYVGVAVGGFVFVIFVVALSTVFYRRRIVYARSTMLIPPNQTVVTATQASVVNPVAGQTVVTQSQY